MRLLDKDTYRQMLVVTLVGTVATIVTASVIWLQVADHQRAEFEWVAQNRNRAFKKAVEEAGYGMGEVVTMSDFGCTGVRRLVVISQFDCGCLRSV